MNPFRMLLGVALVAVLTTGVVAQESIEARLEASTRHQEWIDIEYGADGAELTAFIVHPESSTATDSVIVIHDIRGMSDYVQLVCDELAEAGYFAIAVDFLSGAGPGGGNTDSFESTRDVGQAIRNLDDAKVTAMLDAAYGYAKGLPSTTEHVSVGGYCWGGRSTFAYATQNPNLKAAFVFYGSPPEDEALAKIECPVYGFYGENDARINSTIDATAAKMKELGKTYEPVIYPGMGHGFYGMGMGENASDNYKEQTAAAKKRWLALLAE